MNALRDPIAELTVVAEHAGIHVELEDWGRWSRERRKKVRCGSIEKRWRSPQPWDAPPLSAVLPPNERMLTLDRAVIHIPMGHADALKLHYVHLAPPWLICRRLVIPMWPRYPDLARWLHDARCMVLNRLMVG